MSHAFFVYFHVIVFFNVCVISLRANFTIHKGGVAVLSILCVAITITHMSNLIPLVLSLIFCAYVKKAHVTCSFAIKDGVPFVGEFDSHQLLI